MKYRDLSLHASSACPTLDYHRAARLIVEQQFTSRVQAAEMPHLVDMPDLTPSRFKTLAQYHRAVAQRRSWCEKFAYGGFGVEALDDGADSKGLRFRFRISAVATMFRLLFGTARAPRSVTSD
jgi:hypothetical protein